MDNNLVVNPIFLLLFGLEKTSRFSSEFQQLPNRPPILWYNLTSRNQAPIESIAIAASTRARCFDLITICFEFLSLVSLPKVGPLSRYSVSARSALELQQWSANPFLTHRLRKSFCSGSCLRRSPLPTPTSSPTFLTMTNRPWLGSPTSSIFYTYAELFMILVNLFYSGD